ncbi:MAG: glycosyltransferase family 39 protein [Methylotenera sp.]
MGRQSAVNNDFSKYYQRLLGITVLLGVIAILWGLGSMNLMSLNEGRRALAIKEMFNSGDWLIPRLNGELYLTKPPFLYWISASFSYLFGGVTEWTLRLPSALAALAVLYMAYQYTSKYFGIWAALFTTQLLIANAGFAMLARRAEIEMLLTALCVGAIFSAVHYIKQEGNRYWIYLSYFLLGLAVLTKGPVALLFVTLPLIFTAFWTKDARVKQLLTNKTGWLIFLVVSLSWYIVVTMKLGPDIWATIIKRDMVGKMQGDNNVKPILSYIGWIVVDFLLLAGLLLVKPKALFKRYRDQLPFIIPVLAIVVPLIVFSAFSNKHAKYLLPIYPFLAIVLGVQLASIFEGVNRQIKIGILALGILLPMIFAGFYTLAEARVFDYRVSVFPKFRVWSATVNEPQLYAYGDIDSRLIYYASKPVQSLDKTALNEMRKNHESMILLIEADQLTEIFPNADCKLEEFQPYLKKNKKLVALGFGAACNADDGN